MATTPLPPFGLRLAGELRDRLKHAARGNNRSMNAEIISRLERSFNAPVSPRHIVNISLVEGQLFSSDQVASLMKTLADLIHGGAPGPEKR